MVVVFVGELVVFELVCESSFEVINWVGRLLFVVIVYLGLVVIVVNFEFDVVMVGIVGLDVWVLVCVWCEVDYLIDFDEMIVIVV